MFITISDVKLHYIGTLYYLPIELTSYTIFIRSKFPYKKKYILIGTPLIVTISYYYIAKLYIIINA